MKLSFAFSVSFLVSCMLLGSAAADELVRVTPEEVGLSAQRLARFSAAMDKGIAAGDFGRNGRGRAQCRSHFSKPMAKGPRDERAYAGGRYLSHCVHDQGSHWRGRDDPL